MASLLTHDWRPPETQWITSLIQSAAQIEAGREARRQNAAQELVRAAQQQQQFDERMRFEREQASRLAQQFNVKQAFEVGKETFERKQIERGNAPYAGLPGSKDTGLPSGGAEEALGPAPELGASVPAEKTPAETMAGFGEFLLAGEPNDIRDAAKPLAARIDNPGGAPLTDAPANPLGLPEPGFQPAPKNAAQSLASGMQAPPGAPASPASSLVNMATTMKKIGLPTSIANKELGAAARELFTPRIYGAGGRAPALSVTDQGALAAQQGLIAQEGGWVDPKTGIRYNYNQARGGFSPLTPRAENPLIDLVEQGKRKDQLDEVEKSVSNIEKQISELPQFKKIGISAVGADFYKRDAAWWSGLDVATQEFLKSQGVSADGKVYLKRDTFVNPKLDPPVPGELFNRLTEQKTAAQMMREGTYWKDNKPATPKAGGSDGEDIAGSDKYPVGTRAKHNGVWKVKQDNGKWLAQ